MVKHIVMWKLKEYDDLKMKIAAAFEIKKSLERLTSMIIQIKDLEVGMNFSRSEHAFDVILYSEFETKKDLDHYLNHPEHVRVKRFIDSIVLDMVVVDYEL